MQEDAYFEAAGLGSGGGSNAYGSNRASSSSSTARPADYKEGDEAAAASASASASRSGPITLPPPPKPDSSRALRSQLGWMNENFLGRHVPVHYGGSGNQAKRAVMNACCRRGPRPYGDGKEVAFNKYSGAQPFADAVVLFVNLFGGDEEEGSTSAAGYSNSFTVTAAAPTAAAADSDPPADNGSKGRKAGKSSSSSAAPSSSSSSSAAAASGSARECTMGWWASTKSKDTDSTVLQLIHHQHGARLNRKDGSVVAGAAAAGTGAGTGDDGGDDADDSVSIKACTIGLAIRLDKDEPYVWCGRLQYKQHMPGSRPLRFEWRLLDFEQLVAGMSAETRGKRSDTTSTSTKAAASSRAAIDDAENSNAPSQFARVLKAGGIDVDQAILTPR